MKTQTNITLYGNLGGDPELKTISGKDYTKNVYDAIIDEVVERQFTGRTRSCARSRSPSPRRTRPAARSPAGFAAPTGRDSKLLRKGDRVALKGYFREHSYEKDGEPKTARDFQVLEVSVQKRKVREQAE